MARSEFVHIVRDGRDVALSAMNWETGQACRPLLHLGGGSVSDHRPLVGVEGALGPEGGGSFREGLYHEVRYEDLIYQPGRECVSLWSFSASLTMTPCSISRGQTRMDLPDRREQAAWLPVTTGLRCWRPQMPADDVERFEAAAGDLLDELGYPRATVP